jgi:hypothetical protein
VNEGRMQKEECRKGQGSPPSGRQRPAVCFDVYPNRPWRGPFVQAVGLCRPAGRQGGFFTRRFQPHFGFRISAFGFYENVGFQTGHQNARLSRQRARSAFPPSGNTRRIFSFLNAGCPALNEAHLTPVQVAVRSLGFEVRADLPYPISDIPAERGLA